MTDSLDHVSLEVEQPIEFRYSLTEDDFVNHQLYKVVKSGNYEKKKNRAWLILTLLFGFCAGYTYWKDVQFLFLYWSFLALLSAFGFPTYNRWRNKKHFRKHVRLFNQEKIGREIFVQFMSEEILLKTENGTSSVKLAALTEISEMDDVFYLHLNSNDELIIPKSFVPDCAELKHFFRRNGLTILNQKGWTF